MNEGGDGSVVNMYAQLDSQEMPIPKDLSDYWQDPSSYFLIPGDYSLPCTATHTHTHTHPHPHPHPPPHRHI
jgi:hypothetical protein